MFDQLSAEIMPSLIKGRHNTNNNNKVKCIPGGTLRVLAGKKYKNILDFFTGIQPTVLQRIIYVNLMKIRLDRLESDEELKI
jgi:hypothetical protein